MLNDRVQISVGDSSFQTEFNAAQLAVAAARTSFVTTLVKLDGDAVTDTDYESELTPAAQESRQISADSGVPGQVDPEGNEVAIDHVDHVRVYNRLRRDLVELRTQFEALLVKLDADGSALTETYADSTLGVTGLTAAAIDESLDGAPGSGSSQGGTVNATSGLRQSPSDGDEGLLTELNLLSADLTVIRGAAATPIGHLGALQQLDDDALVGLDVDYLSLGSPTASLAVDLQRRADGINKGHPGSRNAPARIISSEFGSHPGTT